MRMLNADYQYILFTQVLSGTCYLHHFTSLPWIRLDVEHLSKGPGT